MKYAQLGRSGMRVSKLCLGAMVGFDSGNEKQAKAIIDEALDAGVNFIDTADCYRESEETLGRILPADKRDEIVLATKCGGKMGENVNDGGYSRKHMIEACENSLQKLKTDYIDLYIMHVVDPNTPMEEALYTFDILLKQGKIRSIGTSKHPASLLVEGIFKSEKHGLPRFASEQSPYNLLDRTAENELIPVCRKFGISVTAYRPIASGLLSEKHLNGGGGSERTAGTGRKPGGKHPRARELFKKAVDIVEKLKPLADEKGASVSELALGWLMQQEGVSAAILGARTPDYLRSGIKACGMDFSPEELQEIDAVAPPGSSVMRYYDNACYRPLRNDYKSPGSGSAIPRGDI